jgi:hypothetical protein
MSESFRLESPVLYPEVQMLVAPADHDFDGSLLAKDKLGRLTPLVQEL